MPYYSYKARDKKGKLIASQTFAANKQELIKLLQKQEFLIVSVSETASIEETYRKKLHKGVRQGDLVLLAKQLAILLESGVPITETMDVVLKQIESAKLFDTVKDIKKDLEEGMALKDSIVKYPKIFENFWAYLVETGELSGQLPLVLRQIGVFLESREKLKKETVNAFLYPVLLFTLAIFTIFVFIFRVVPIFEELFGTFGAQLPIFTKAVVLLSNVVRNYFFIVMAALFVAGFLLKKALSTVYGRRIVESVLLRIPILGYFLLSLSIERFASTLGILLKNGIPIIKALEISAKTSESVTFAERINEAKSKVTGGLALSEALYQTNLFPAIAVQLILVAEKTGNFSGMLDEISEYYHDIVETTMTRFTTLLGPVVLIFMAAVIGGLIIAMFMPIFKFATLG